MPINPRPPFPTFIDSSMRAEFVACPHRFYLKYLNGLVPNIPSTHLHAGVCFAHALHRIREFYYDAGSTPERALEQGLVEFTKEWGSYTPPPDSIKTYERMFGAIVNYFEEYPLDSDPFRPIETPNGHALEFSAAIPLTETHPETGEPIIYTMRADAIGRINDLLLIEDDKTTSRLGPNWAAQWDMRSQFTGYVWGARSLGLDAAGVLVRGISILKNDYGHAQVITTRTQHDIDIWYDQLMRDIRRMKQCWAEGIWDRNLDTACALFSACPYKQLCTSPNPNNWIEPDFVQRIYNPV